MFSGPCCVLSGAICMIVDVVFLTLRGVMIGMEYFL